MTSPMNTSTHSSTARCGGTSGRTSGCAARRGGFTLMEIMIVTVIIIILAGLIFIAVGAGLKTAREATERQFIRNLATGVEQFKQSFRFYPPLVDDAMPLDLVTKRILVQTGNTGDGPLEALRYLSENVPGSENVTGSENVQLAVGRFSEHSLPIFIGGVLGQEYDGVEGPGFFTPTADGQFSKVGPKTDSFIDTSRDADRLARGTGGTIPVYRDRWESAIRYYRWEQGRFPKGNERAGEVRFNNVPQRLGDVQTNPKLRDGGFAIVSPGRDRRISAGATTTDDDKDNIVEIAQ